MGSRDGGWKVRNLTTASPAFSLETSVFLLEPGWAINHVLCVVSQVQGRRAGAMENLPSWACSEPFPAPPVFGQGCQRKKANMQSQLGEQLLGVVTLVSFTGQGLSGAWW